MSSRPGRESPPSGLGIQVWALVVCTVCAAGITVLNILDLDWISVAIGVVLVLGLIAVLTVGRRRVR